MEKYDLKVGLFGIGLEAYWDQFEGLEQRLRLESEGVAFVGGVGGAVVGVRAVGRKVDAANDDARCFMHGEVPE